MSDARAALKYIPAWIFGLGSVFMVLPFLLHLAPSSAWVWALYLNLMPIFRDIQHSLEASAGISHGMMLAALVVMTLASIHLATTDKPYLRSRFILAHSAMLLLLPNIGLARVGRFAMAGQSDPGAGHVGWTLVTANINPAGAVLFALALTACIPVHRAILAQSRA